MQVDQALLKYVAQKRGLPAPEISIELSKSPDPPNRFLKGYDTVAVNGPMYFFIPPMVIFGALLSEIVKEKEYRLRHGLIVMGVSHTTFWVSWVITGFGMMMIVTNLLIIAGKLWDFSVFVNTPYLILLMIFGEFGIAMACIAFLASTFINTTRLAYTFSYTIILTGLVIQMFL